MPTAVMEAPPEAGVDPGTGPVEPAPTHEIENRTARRIAISFRDADECLVIPPFGRRTVARSTYRRLDLEGWLCRGLVRLPAEERRNSAVVQGAVGVGVWVLLISTVVVLFNHALLRSGRFWSLEGALFAVLLAAGAVGYARGRERVGRAAFRAFRWLGLAAVLMIGFGVPWLLLQGQLAELGRPNGVEMSQLGKLFLTIFVVFVGIVSTLPAMLYFLFDEQRMECVRTRFFREVMQLDPAIQTLDDAETTYEPLMEGVYGRNRRGMLVNLSITPVLVSTLLITLGWTVTLLPTLDEIRSRTDPLGKLSLVDFMDPRPGAFTYAFLGAYFFTLNMVFRRYVRADLGPKAYSHISLRIIIAVVLAWVAGAISTTTGPHASAPTAVLLVLAFFIGIVPETGMALYHDFLKSQGVLGKVFPSVQEKDPLTRLRGITLYDRARLLEEGIENVENLAHHSLIELMLRTRIPTSRLVDLVDQAILYLHLQDGDGEDGAAGDQAVLNRLGIRTATDLEAAARAAEDAGMAEALYSVLGSEGAVLRLRSIRTALADDEWMVHLRHWRKYRTIYDQLFSYESFHPRRVAREAA